MKRVRCVTECSPCPGVVSYSGPCPGVVNSAGPCPGVVSSSGPCPGVASSGGPCPGVVSSGGPCPGVVSYGLSWSYHLRQCYHSLLLLPWGRHSSALCPEHSSLPDVEHSSEIHTVEFVPSVFLYHQFSTEAS